MTNWSHATRLLEQIFDRIGLAWTRTLWLLSEGRPGDIMTFDAFIVLSCVLVVLWMLTLERQSRGGKR